MSDHPDAELLRRCSAFDHANAELVRVNSLHACPDAEVVSVNKRWDAAIQAVRDLKVQTAEGRQAKARIAYTVLRDVVSNHHALEQPEEQFALNVLAEFAGIPHR